MANYDFMPGLMNMYQNRNTSEQQVLNPQAAPYVVNPDNPEQFIPDPSFKAGPETWASINQSYNPNGMFNTQDTLNQFNSIKNNPAYTNLYGPAPTSGNPQDIYDYMTLLRAGGGKYAGTQTNAFGSFMGDYGFMLPMGAAAGVAAATGGLGSMFGAGSSSLAGSGSGEFGLSALDMPGAGIGTSGYTGLGTSGANMFDFGDALSGVFDGGSNVPSWMDPSANYWTDTFQGANTPQESDFWDWGPGNSPNTPPSGDWQGGTPSSGGVGPTGPTGSGSGGWSPGMNDVLRATNMLSNATGSNNRSGNNQGGIDWGTLLGGGLGALYNNSQIGAQSKELHDLYSQMQAQNFPFSEFYGQARDFADPNKRYQMMLNNPGYLASRDYVTKAQGRRNAQTGDIKSGYGDSILADVIGKNAQSWDSQNFDQIKAMTGMGFNNSALTGAAMLRALPDLYKLRASQGTDIGNILTKSGVINQTPNILSYLGSGISGGLDWLGSLFS